MNCLAAPSGGDVASACVQPANTVNQWHAVHHARLLLLDTGYSTVAGRAAARHARPPVVVPCHAIRMASRTSRTTAISCPILRGTHREEGCASRTTVRLPLSHIHSIQSITATAFPCAASSCAFLLVLFFQSQAGLDSHRPVQLPTGTCVSRMQYTTRPCIHVYPLPVLLVLYPCIIPMVHI